MKKYLLGFVLFGSFLISACGSGQLFGPTLTPTATPDPHVPKPGKWDGGDISKDGFSIELFVTEEGKIANFYFAQNLGFASCFMNLTLWGPDPDDSKGLDVNGDGYFSYIDYSETAGFSGTFDTPETANGIVHIRYCDNGVKIESATGDYDFEWHAKWVSEK